MPVVEFSDPQGSPDISYNFSEGIRVYNDTGLLLFTLPLYCGEGKCGNRWSEFDTNPPLRCEGSVDYRMVLQLSDKLGNLSEPVELVLNDKE